MLFNINTVTRRTYEKTIKTVPLFSIDQIVKTGHGSSNLSIDGQLYSVELLGLPTLFLHGPRLWRDSLNLYCNRQSQGRL